MHILSVLVREQYIVTPERLYFVSFNWRHIMSRLKEFLSVKV